MTAILTRWRDRRHERSHQRKVFICDEHCGCDCVDRVLCRHDEFGTIGGRWCAHCGHPIGSPEDADALLAKHFPRLYENGSSTPTSDDT